MINIKPNKNANNANKNSNEKNKLNIKIAIGIALLLVVIVVIGLLVYFDNRYVMDNSIQIGNEEETEEPKPVYLGDVYTFPNPDAPFNDDSLEESTRKFLVTEYFSYHGKEILKDFPEIADIENDMDVFNSQFLTLYDETGLVGYTPFSRWGEIFGSATLTNAVLDRLLHHSSVISIKGPSYSLMDKRAFLEAQEAEVYRG